jgi:hypothetical protein
MAAAPMIRICVRLGFYRHDPVGVHIGGYRTLPNQLMVTLRRRLTGCRRPKMDEQACMPP